MVGQGGGGLVNNKDTLASIMCILHALNTKLVSLACKMLMVGGRVPVGAHLTTTFMRLDTFTTGMEGTTKCSSQAQWVSLWIPIVGSIFKQ